MLNVGKNLQILEDRSYKIKARGVIQVKGKGDMMTYYVLGRKITRKGQFGLTVKDPSTCLAEVVYGMVRARKRRTAKRGRDARSAYVFFVLGPAISSLFCN